MRPIMQWQLVNDPFGDPGVYGEFMFEKRAVLFDLGDIANLSPRKLLRLSHVFVSHAHMDHFAGFDPLLRVLLGRNLRLCLYGPPGFIDRLEHKLRAYSWNRIRSYGENLMLDVSEIGPAGLAARAAFQSKESFARETLAPAADEGDTVARGEGFRVRAATLDHEIPCLAFAFEENRHVNVWKNRLAAEGLAVGPWLRELKAAVLAGAPDETPIPAAARGGKSSSTVVRPLGELKRTVLKIVPGQRVAYVTDVVYHDDNAAKIAALANEADILFIETPFLHQDVDAAAKKCHLTAHQAGLIARRSRAKRMVPFHFSPRYSGRAEDIRREAETAFTGADETAALR
jgi:ribonuclease Z